MRSEGYSTWCVCLSVSLCVDAYSGTTGYEAAYKRNQRLQNHKCVKNKKRNDCVREVWRENKRKSQYADEYSLTARLLQRPLARCFDDRLLRAF